jgi:hypothetical protein
LGGATGAALFVLLIPNRRHDRAIHIQRRGVVRDGFI